MILSLDVGHEQGTESEMMRHILRILINSMIILKSMMLKIWKAWNARKPQKVLSNQFKKLPW
ncbi:hypothetical protein ACJIZ3_015993 [Penstemon smallii]|uniref:Uncharacterized protein n=1 Tax=Penstemon smallii TaxID=265156 RepID=A0ABD3RUS6_9LAMI